MKRGAWSNTNHQLGSVWNLCAFLAAALETECAWVCRSVHVCVWVWVWSLCDLAKPSRPKLTLMYAIFYQYVGVWKIRLQVFRTATYSSRRACHMRRTGDSKGGGGNWGGTLNMACPLALQIFHFQFPSFFPCVFHISHAVCVNIFTNYFTLEWNESWTGSGNHLWQLSIYWFLKVQWFFGLANDFNTAR